jgi:hypothetical protein
MSTSKLSYSLALFYFLLGIRKDAWDSLPFSLSLSISDNNIRIFMIYVCKIRMEWSLRVFPEATEKVHLHSAQLVRSQSELVFTPLESLFALG